MANQRGKAFGYYAEAVGDYEADDLEADLGDEEIMALEAELDDNEARADYDEALAEDDETSALEADDEGYTEADDESAVEDDEAYSGGEDVGEPEAPPVPQSLQAAMQRASIQARMRADARNRQAQAAQRATVRHAIGVQRKLDQQLGRIRGPAPVGLRRLDMLRGSGVVTAQLPNGRTTRLMITPPLATREDVNRLTQQIGVNDVRQAKAIQQQGRTIAQLKSAQATAIKSLTAEQLKISKDLTKRLSDSETKLDKRITKEVIDQES